MSKHVFGPPVVALNFHLRSYIAPVPRPPDLIETATEENIHYHLITLFNYNLSPQLYSFSDFGDRSCSVSSEFCDRVEKSLP